MPCICFNVEASCHCLLLIFWFFEEVCSTESIKKVRSIILHISQLYFLFLFPTINSHHLFALLELWILLILVLLFAIDFIYLHLPRHVWKMLETVDFTPEKKHRSPKVRFLFILLSFSYMLPWTAMGSLIHYFSVEYNKNYFTILNIAFYGVGLPITFMQKRIDNYYGKYCVWDVWSISFSLCLFLSISLSLSMCV